MSRTADTLLKAALTAGFFCAMASPALAGIPTPGPLLGAGAPALIVLGAAYYLVRKARNRS